MKYKKAIAIFGAIAVILFISYFGFVRKRYVDVLHTKINLEEFAAEDKGIEEIVDWYHRTYHIPAISVAIVRNGAVSKFFSRGVRARDIDDKATARCIYRIASTGKLLIGIISKSLENEGKLNIDKSILDYLDHDFSAAVKNKLCPISVKNLLHHNSGLGRDWDAFSKKDIMEALANFDLDFKPGEKWSYSNFGYALLTLILENSSGLTYHELLKRYVIDQYQFSFVSSTLQSYDTAFYITPYLPEWRLLKGEDKDYGMETLTSGIYRNKSPLVLNHQKIETWNERSFYGFGMFEFNFEDDENPEITHQILEHGGDANGFACHYGFFPEYESGLVVLTSSGGKWFQEMCRNINEKLIDSR